MNQRGFPSYTLCIGLIIGILLGSFFEISINCSLSFLILAFIALILAHFLGKRQGLLFSTLSLIAFMVLGLHSANLRKVEWNPSHFVNQSVNENTQWHLKIQQKLRATNFNQRYVAQVISLDQKKSSGKILVISNLKDSLGLGIDGELIYIGKVNEIAPPLNPHQFDYAKYLENLDIHAKISLNKKNNVSIAHHRKTIYGYAARVRHWAKTQLTKAGLEKEPHSIMQAMLLGERNEVTKDVYDDFKNSGTVHILAISGLHIGIILWLLNYILNPLTNFRFGRKLKTILILLILWTYAFIAGFSPSVVRAVTMFSFLAYAIHLNRPHKVFNLIALSIIAILLVYPKMLFQVGFQLSYAAVLGIVTFYSRIMRVWHPKNWVLNKLWQWTVVGLSAQIGVLPLSLFYFHQFPALFFIGNLVIVPFLGAIMGLGIATILLSSLGFLPPFLGWVLNGMLLGLLDLVNWVGNQKAFLFEDIPFNLVQVIIAYMIVLLFSRWIILQNLKTSIAMLSMVSIFMVTTIYLKWQSNQKSELWIANQFRNTTIIDRNGGKARVFSRHPDNSKFPLKDYLIGERIKEIEYAPLQNSYLIENKLLLVIDSSSVIPKNTMVDYLLLTQSPSINLERVLLQLKPKLVIADASNYQNFISHWKATCHKKKVPFYYTGESGALYIGGTSTNELRP